MLVRTNLAALTRAQQVKTLTENGRDLARISDESADSCDVCSEWGGRIVSLTGATKGYPTLAEAKAAGVFHPNCTHRLEVVTQAELDAEPGKDGGGGKAPKAPKKPGSENDPQQKVAKAAQKRTNPAKMVFDPSKIDPTVRREHDINGMKQGKPMTHEEADNGRTNPHFNEGKEWQINCQTCVVAYEARRRGFDCEATPNYESTDPRAAKSQSNAALSISPKDAFESRTNGAPVMVKQYTNATWDNSNVAALIGQDIKPGERYHIIVYWKPKPDKNGRLVYSGHILCAERTLNGVLFWYDPQTNKRYDDAAFALELKEVISGKVFSYRVDDKDFSSLGKAVLVKAGTSF